MSPSDRVRGVVEPAVAGAGLVLEGVTTTPAGKRRVVRVVVDLPDDATGSLDLDQVADVSRAVAAALDADDAVLGGAPYVLEVTTPGVDRPLTQRRHWSRAGTRLVTVPVAGTDVTGRVAAVDDEGVLLDVGGQQRRVVWADLGTGHVQVEFSRTALAEDAEDAEGAEDATEGDEDGED